MQQLRNRKGFTLIELLVVIAIIAMLLSILMPSLRKAKEVARNVVCKTNLKGWGMTFHVFATENNDKTTEPISADSDQLYWMKSIYSYCEKQDIFICPSASSIDGWEYRNQSSIAGASVTSGGRTSPWWIHGTSNSLDLDWLTGYNPSEGWHCSYGMNLWESNVDGGYTPDNFPAEGFWGSFKNTKSPAEVPLMSDCAWAGGTPGPNDPVAVSQEDGDIWRIFTGQGWPSGGNSNMMRYGLTRHGKGINHVFCDGSVGDTDVKGLYTLKWSKIWRQPNIEAREWPSYCN